MRQVAQLGEGLGEQPVTLATTWGEMIRDLVILAIAATLAALVPAVRSVRIRILDAIWGT